MKNDKFDDRYINKAAADEELFVGADDEEVLNCDGEPCNFVLKNIDAD